MTGGRARAWTRGAAGVLAGLCAWIAAGASPVAGAATAATAPAATGTSAVVTGGPAVYTVTLDDVIHPLSARYFKDSLQRAEREGAALFILKLDTPGGLMDSMEDMINRMTHARVPVVVFVHGTKAASAGFFLTIAADVAVMAPGTRFGAAHPVLAIGDIPADSPMAAKVENDAAAYVRSIATNRHRNAVEAEKAVRESRAFTEQEALKLGLIDFVARDEAEIVAKLDGRPIRRFSGESVTIDLKDARVVSLDMSRRDRFLRVLANPTLAALLLFAGILGLYIEFTHPGLIAPGLVGAVCLVLFVFASQMLPINWIGVALVVLGCVLFLLELKVISHGALAGGGIVCLVLGALILFPNSPEVPGWRAARLLILAVAAGVGSIMAILSILVTRIWRLKPLTGASGLVDERGTALTDLEPDGRVFVHGESWNARAATRIAKGARVRVTGVHDLVLDVDEVRGS
jgi:membrane-bound serine protease (ClpP class)